MPVITPVDIKVVEVGTASDFRGTINANFEAIKTEFSEVYNMITSVVISKTQPGAGELKKGDFWLKEL